LIAPAIIARQVSKTFGSGPSRAAVLRGVSLEVARGEVVFLVGPSGSGKTTLLSILGCLLSADRGRVEVLGRNVVRMSAEERAAFRQEHLGFIFQTFNLFPTLSGLDNVRLALTMRGVSLGEASRRGAQLLEQVGLGSRGQLHPGQLSTGECQRVAVARALAGSPLLLFADEPTASLDAENGLGVMDLLRRLVKFRGMTLVVVSHDSRVFSFADRILHLENGRLSREGTEGEEPIRAARIHRGRNG
jgi:putative ABC transport system ATP-binding protein